MLTADLRRRFIQPERTDDEGDPHDLPRAQNKRHEKRYQNALPKTARDALRQLCAHVLPGIGRHGALDAEDRDHQDILHPAGHRVRCDHALAVVVDELLQKQKPTRDDRLLQRHRQADA